MCRLKNRASYRTVPLGQVVVDALARHLERFPSGEVEVDDETDPATPVKRKVLLLFTNGRGKPINRDAFNPQVWRPACTRAAEALRGQAAGERDASERPNCAVRPT